MGAAHSQAWRTAGRVFDLPLRPAMVAALRPRPARRPRPRPAARLGVRRRPTGAAGRPGRHRPDRHLHAGRHPRRDRHRGARGRQARAVREAVWPTRSPRPRRWSRRPSGRGQRGIRSMVGFNYRRVPALALARALVAEGRLGAIRHVRAVYLQDWIVDPEFPLVWRLQKEHAGSGALGDIGAHIVDLAQFVARRPAHRGHRADRDVRQGAAAAGGLQRAGGDRRDRRRGDGDRRRRGAVHRPVRRRSAGALRGDPVRHRPQERDAHRDQRLARQPGLRLRGDERAVLLRRHRRSASWPASAGSWSPSPAIPYLSAWWPPGHVLGYEHTFTHEIRDLVDAIGPGQDPSPSFADGLQVQRVLAAVERSAGAGSGWQSIPAPAL